MNITFVSYERTETEKYLGIATVSVSDNAILKYKVFAGKNGKGWFICPPSIKVGEIYSPVFRFDSKDLNDQILAIIRKNLPKADENQEPKSDNNKISPTEELPF